MTISYPLSLPLSDFARVRVRRNDGASVSRSPFTRKASVQVFDALSWEVSIDFPLLSYTVAQPLLAFCAALRGGTGTFVLPHPTLATSSGTAGTVGGSPTVNGNGQTGATVNITSAPLSQTAYFVAGDHIQIGPTSRAHWYRILEDADTDGSGQATLSIWPDLREGVINGDAIRYASPLCLFRQTSVVQEEEYEPALKVRISIEAEEDL